MKKTSILALITLICGIILTTLAYFFADKPTAYFVFKHPTPIRHILLQLTYIPPIILTIIVPIVILGCLIYMCWKPLTKFLLILFVTAINLSIVYNIKNSLKWSFGRTWPLTWTGNNPSLIKDNVFGFHFFHGGIGYSAFPSGHAAILATTITTLWVFYPKWRWLYIIVGLAVILSLLALNYHFVSDIIAGLTLGIIAGLYANYFLTKSLM